MACAERRISHVGIVAAMLVVIIGVSRVSEVAAGTLRRATTSTTSPELRVSATPTSDWHAEVTSTTSGSAQTQCDLVALDPYQAGRVHDLVKAEGIILLEYILVFPNNTVNPLKHNMKHVFKGDTWTRVSGVHGETLLSLSFNYGILSLKTLTFGTDKRPVNVTDRPHGCMTQLNETDKVDTVLRLLMTDFETQEPSLDHSHDQAKTRVCYEKIVDDGRGYAKFIDRCCYHHRIMQRVICETQRKNGWLMFLYVLLRTIHFGILAFGPLLFLSTVTGLVREEFPYSVELQDPLIKKVVIYRKDTGDNPAENELKGRRCLDLCNQSGFAKLREITLNDRVPIGTKFRAKFSQYDILISYKRLLTENNVPVGFWRNLIRNVFFCKLRHIKPFRQCCRVDMLHPWIRRLFRLNSSLPKRPWIVVWKKIGLALLILLMPTPYYIRLFIYYQFESTEVLARKEAAAKLGLTEVFENSLVHYLLPTHPLFLCIYAVYVIMAVNLAYIVRHDESGRFRKIIVESFTDLKNLSWINVLRIMIGNVIWPFQKFGLGGCVVMFVYWPIALPLIGIICAFYYLPTIFLTVRMFFYSKRAFLRRATKRPVKKSYRVRRTVDNSMRYFDASYLLGKDDDNDEDESSGQLAKPSFAAETPSTTLSFDERRKRSKYDSPAVDNVTNVRLSNWRSPSMSSTEFTWLGRGQARVRHFIAHCGAATLCVTALYSTLIVLSECVGCLVEMFVFTLMGIIVNAGSLLKFVALAVMLVAYSYDCFNNVEKK